MRLGAQDPLVEWQHVWFAEQQPRVLEGLGKEERLLRVGVLDARGTGEHKSTITSAMTRILNKFRNVYRTSSMPEYAVGVRQCLTRLRMQPTFRKQIKNRHCNQAMRA